MALRYRPLDYLIHHIFLPPKMSPRSGGGNDASAEEELLMTVHGALEKFRQNCEAAQISALDRCTHMVAAMGTLQRPAAQKNGFLWRVDVFGQQMVDLKDDGSLAMYMHRQNVGLLVSRMGDELRFESMELLAPDHIVMACEGRLRRCFPTRTVAVARSRIIDPEFLQPFLQVLAQVQSTGHPREDLIGDPALVNDMIMGVLRGIGRRVEDESASSIYKHVREEALAETWPKSAVNRWQGGTTFWRRSPLWLLVRVVLQLTLTRAAEQHDGDGEGKRRGRFLYKAVMLVIMSCVLERAIGEQASHHLLFFMKAKISQRLLKLGPAAEEAPWCKFPRNMLHDVDMALTQRWSAIQSEGAEALSIFQHANLDFAWDTLLSLNNLKPYLAWIAHRKPMDASINALGVVSKNDSTDRSTSASTTVSKNVPKNALKTVASPRNASMNVSTIDWNDTSQTVPLGQSKRTEVPQPTGRFHPSEKLRDFELFDFENWVEKYAKKHTSPNEIQTHKAEEAEGTEGTSRNTAANYEGGTVEVSHESRGLFPGLVEGHSNSGVWQRDVDNAFAKTYWAQHMSQTNRDWQQESSWLCDKCSTLQVFADDFELFVSPAAKLGNCDLCEMLYHALWPRGAGSSRPVRVRRKGTNLWAGDQSRPILRMCVGPGWKGQDTVQVGTPKLLERSSPCYYELLRSWLRHCDNHHGKFGCRTVEPETLLPTRVIDVGDGMKNELRLVCTKPLDRGRYLALSHRWGTPSDEERRHNCTFADNLEERCRRIPLAKLGKTFQDAVQITRALGERYLWIDSLCIIQNDGEDWVRESQGMEAIFSSAYCVIAATAAEGTHSGFLNTPPVTQSVILSTPSDDPLYLCSTVDDFRGDVEDTSLSCRGWVLQERALARRTIHFSANQTYWECGRGIQCETMSLLSNQEASFLGDPQFPKLAMAKAVAENAEHRVFQAVFERYSRLELTYDYDRPSAIAGLERRLAEEMASPVAFGVFANHDFGRLHRSLLWRRADGSRLEWIKNPHVQVPTWSWMAYTGAIDYLNPSSTGVEWDRGIALETTPGPAKLTAPITEFTAEMTRNQSALIMDTWTTVDVRNLKCVVVGREPPAAPESRTNDEAYHILVVSLVQQNAASPEYERVGVATVRAAHLELDNQNKPARII